MTATAICNISPSIVVCREDAVLLVDMEQTEWEDIETASKPLKVLTEDEEIPPHLIERTALRAVDEGSQELSHRGRHKATAKFPQLVSTIQDLLSQQTVSAQNRRRDDSGRIGVTATEIRDYLSTRGMPVHVSTVRRLFKAPNPRTKSASRYSNLFNVRLASHIDTGKEDHIDAHHCAAQVRLMVEAAVHCNAEAEEVAVMSVDTKCVVPLGCLAVSKHIRRTSYLMEKHVVPDHSFVTGSNVKPVVFMWLDTVGKASERECDSQDREHLPYPRNGPMRIFLRSCRYIFPHKPPVFSFDPGTTRQTVRRTQLIFAKF